MLTGIVRSDRSHCASHELAVPCAVWRGFGEMQKQTRQIEIRVSIQALNSSFFTLIYSAPLGYQAFYARTPKAVRLSHGFDILSFCSHMPSQERNERERTTNEGQIVRK